MVIPIPYGMDYTSTMTGAVLKLVRCEQCGVEYVYRLQRTASGTGSSLLFLDNQGAGDRASTRAEGELQGKLERGVDLVPCPSCGWIQEHMFPRARRAHRRWMLITGAWLTFGLLPIAFIGGIANGASGDPPAIPWPVFSVGLSVLAVLGFGLMIAKVVLARRYDPNSQNVEIRKRLGQARGILREQLEKMTRTAQENATAHGGITEQREGIQPPPVAFPLAEALARTEDRPVPRPVPVHRPGTCPECGVVNPKGSRTCAACGHGL
jgi:hypothetical protein